MAVNKVDLYVSQILEDLDNGLTWLKRDDIGYGSIQEKYNAKDQQIAMIRKHPALKDAETNITVFNIIDDTTNGGNSTATTANGQTVDQLVGSVSEPLLGNPEHGGPVSESSNQNDAGSHTDRVPASVSDDLAAFVNL